MKDISSHVMDILQNSIRAKARRIEVDIIEDTVNDIYRLVFVDNGSGMEEAIMLKVIDPFFTTRRVRKVGLGLPLLKQNAEKAGGSILLDSKVGEGTTVQATFSHKHIDRPVLGDIAGAIVLTASSNLNLHFIYRHKKDGKEFVFDTDSINEVLDGVSMQNPEVITSLRELINENLKNIGVEGMQLK
ncbi:MAG: ATP-binding protein [Bacteroidales bacterium]|jgi:hypothetical protein|nr:ATP-binding protein [Bacteroidales bacterium]